MTEPAELRPFSSKFVSKTRKNDCGLLDTRK
jgi:hypothetical protein